MKAMKKVFALLLAVVMVMSLSVGAFAEGETETAKGSITVTNASIGQTYNVYKIFDATLNDDTNPTGISYTATEEQKTFYENQNENPFVFTKNADGTYYVTIGTDSSTNKKYTDAEIIAFLQGFYTKTENADGTTTIALNANFAKVVTVGTATEATSSTLTFSNLDYGYYLVTSSLGAVVTIDSTYPDVEVIDKNTEEPTTDDNMKKIVITDENGTTSLVDSTTASVGDTLNFQVTVHAVNFMTAENEETGKTETTLITKYVVTDTPTNMAIDSTSIAVKVGNTTLENTADDTKYTVAVDEKTGVLTVTIPWAKDTDNDGTEDASLYAAPTDIVVTYSAEVLAGAADDDATNSAVATYNDGKNIGDDTTDVSTYYFDLTKTDGANKVAEGETGVNTSVLAGAVFELYTTETEGTAIQLVDDGEGVYHVADSTEIEAAKTDTTIKLTTEITTPESGKVQVKGLANGTYYLEETKAPDGYNLLASRTPFTIKDADKADTVDQDSNVTAYGVEIENNAGSALPATGGIGTTIFYVVGAILVLGAAVLLITKKRMSGVE